MGIQHFALITDARSAQFNEVARVAKELSELCLVTLFVADREWKRKLDVGAAVIVDLPDYASESFFRAYQLDHTYVVVNVGGYRTMRLSDSAARVLSPGTRAAQLMCSFSFQQLSVRDLLKKHPKRRFSPASTRQQFVVWWFTKKAAPVVREVTTYNVLSLVQ